MRRSTEYLPQAVPYRRRAGGSAGTVLDAEIKALNRQIEGLVNAAALPGEVALDVNPADGALNALFHDQAGGSSLGGEFSTRLPITGRLTSSVKVWRNPPGRPRPYLQGSPRQSAEDPAAAADTARAINEFESPRSPDPLLRIKLALRDGGVAGCRSGSTSVALTRAAHKNRPALTTGAPPATSGWHRTLRSDRAGQVIHRLPQRRAAKGQAGSVQ